MYTIDVYAGLVVYFITSMMVFRTILRDVIKYIPTSWPKPVAMWIVAIVTPVVWWIIMLILAGNLRPNLAKVAIASNYCLIIPIVIFFAVSINEKA